MPKNANDIDNLDRLARRILSLVQQCNQISTESIGQTIGISASTVQRRLHGLRSRGIIEADVSIISPEKVGRTLLIILEVEMERENPIVLSEFKKMMLQRPEVMQCYYVTGKSDFVLMLSFTDMPAFEEFSEKYILSNKNVRKFLTNVVISKVKYGLTIPIDID